MPEYIVAVKSSAQKEWDALDNQLFNRIENHIIALAANPRPSGCTKLKKEINLWRIRIGDYRIVYIIDDVNRTVRITRIAHRSSVYE